MFYFCIGLQLVNRILLVIVLPSTGCLCPVHCGLCGCDPEPAEGRTKFACKITKSPVVTVYLRMLFNIL